MSVFDIRSSRTASSLPWIGRQSEDASVLDGPANREMIDILKPCIAGWQPKEIMHLVIKEAANPGPRQTGGRRPEVKSLADQACLPMKASIGERTFFT